MSLHEADPRLTFSLALLAGMLAQAVARHLEVRIHAPVHPRHHRKRHAALVAGWDAVTPLLKPGETYSRIAAVATETIRAAGFPDFVYATPHGLGLEHTDDPKPVGLALGSGWDTTLEAGMVLNVDLPYTEIGWGSVHIEDTILITDDGYEALTTQDLDIIVAA